MNLEKYRGKAIDSEIVIDIIRTIYGCLNLKLENRVSDFLGVADIDGYTNYVLKNINISDCDKFYLSYEKNK